ncbi:hypothetical protein [Gemmobacter lutimaris]|nr:hypothetical protein [Gemmobacter lutimaris]
MTRSNNQRQEGDSVALTLDELAGSNHPSDNLAQREGAMRRARAFGRPTG